MVRETVFNILRRVPSRTPTLSFQKANLFGTSMYLSLRLRSLLRKRSNSSLKKCKNVKLNMFQSSKFLFLVV